MDSKKQGMKALRLYHKFTSVTKTIQTLGYPGRAMLIYGRKAVMGRS